MDKWHSGDHLQVADRYFVEVVQAVSILWAAKCFAIPPSNFAESLALQSLGIISSSDQLWAWFCLVCGLAQIVGLGLMAMRHPPRIHIPIRLAALGACSCFFFLVGVGYVVYTPDRVIAPTVLFVGIRGWWSLIRTALTSSGTTIHH